MHTRGFSIIEVLVAVGVLGIVMMAVTAFQVNIFSSKSFAEGSLLAVQDARAVLRIMTSELRGSGQGDNGAYAIAQAATNTITFFSDVDGDGGRDQVRYFLSNKKIMKGVIKPFGSPVEYGTSTETITTLISNVVNASSTNIFDYYDTTYAGTTSPLTYPITTTSVRLVKINIALDVDPRRSPISRTYTTQVTLRNLKDNY